MRRRSDLNSCFVNYFLEISQIAARIPGGISQNDFWKDIQRNKPVRKSVSPYLLAVIELQKERKGIEEGTKTMIRDKVVFTM